VPLFKIWLVRIISALLICICFTSSASIKPRPEVFTLYVDDSFSQAEMKAISSGANMWEKATIGTIKFVLKPKHTDIKPYDLLVENVDPIILRGDPNDPGLLFFELITTGAPMLGFSPPGKYVILVPDRMKEKELIIVSAHELGHFLGMQHIPSIMTTNLRSCITKYDLIQFCEKYGCSTKDTIPTCPKY